MEFLDSAPSICGGLPSPKWLWGKFLGLEFYMPMYKIPSRANLVMRGPPPQIDGAESKKPIYPR